MNNSSVIKITFCGNDCGAIVHFLKTNNINYYYIEHKEKCPHKFALKGLPMYNEITEIEESLLSSGISAKHAYQFRFFKPDWHLTPIFLVVLK